MYKIYAACMQIRSRQTRRKGGISIDCGILIPATLRVGAWSSQADAAGYVIFPSYKWINKSPRATSPNDVNNTQYGRMIRAVEAFLEMHSFINRQRLGIWIIGPD